jgi:hypothetical protein
MSSGWSRFCGRSNRDPLLSPRALSSGRIFIDIGPYFSYRLPNQIPLAKDFGRRHRPMERVRFPRARARHLRSRAASGQRPAGTMTGLRGASLDWDRKERVAPVEQRAVFRTIGIARPDHVPGSASGAELRRWLAAASAAVEHRQAARPAGRAPRPLPCPRRKRRGTQVGVRRLEYASAGVPPPSFFVARMERK